LAAATMRCTRWGASGGAVALPPLSAMARAAAGSLPPLPP
jgi:hypothetical protein